MKKPVWTDEEKAIELQINPLARMNEAMDLIKRELARAILKHPTSFNSHHEGYAVILEELDEYKAEVFKGGSTPRDPEALKTELVQVAAMAARALVDLCL